MNNHCNISGRFLGHFLFHHPGSQWAPMQELWVSEAHTEEAGPEGQREEIFDIEIKPGQNFYSFSYNIFFFS